MKISEILKKRNSGFSFEFFPPKTDKGFGVLGEIAARLKSYDPLYFSMTYGAGGKTRENTRQAVSLLMQDSSLTVMPHLTCLGSDKPGISDILKEYKSKGIENIMALRGDPPLGEPGFDSRFRELCYAKDLVEFIKKEADFCVGVAVYPEGHIESPDLLADMEYTRQKVESGAGFAVTQMFFDNDYFYSFLDRMKKSGINIPVLPGILPLTDVKKVKEFASICRATIPRRAEERLRSFKDPRDAAKAGIEFTIEQCRGLIKNGIARIHFFTLNKPEVITSVLEAL